MSAVVKVFFSSTSRTPPHGAHIPLLPPPRLSLKSPTSSTSVNFMVLTFKKATFCTRST